MDDSKKLSEKRRELLYDQIAAQAVAWAIAWVEPEEIDEINILNSRIKAMQMAVDSLSPQAEFALVDGNRDHEHLYSIKTPHKLLLMSDVF